MLRLPTPGKPERDHDRPIHQTGPDHQRISPNWRICLRCRRTRHVTSFNLGLSETCRECKVERSEWNAEQRRMDQKQALIQSIANHVTAQRPRMAGSYPGAEELAEKFHEEF